MNISRSEIRHVVGPLLPEKNKAHLERLTLLVFPAVVISELGFRTGHGSRSEMKKTCLRQVADIVPGVRTITPELIETTTAPSFQLDAIRPLLGELFTDYGCDRDLLAGWFERAFEFGVEQSRVFNLKSDGLLYCNGDSIARQLAMLICSEERYFAPV